MISKNIANIVLSTVLVAWYRYMLGYMHRADSRIAHSQSNAVSHWLGANPDAALYAGLL